MYLVLDALFYGGCFFLLLENNSSMPPGSTINGSLEGVELEWVKTNLRQ